MSLFDITFIGIGLAIDASCVCTTSGLIYKPNIKNTFKIVLPFVVFQGIMPLIGYFGVGLMPISIFSYNHIFALVLLGAIGIKMLIDARKDNEYKTEENIREQCPTVQLILIQAVSTSIDALSVGVALNNQTIHFMFVAVVIIAIITFIMCFIAVKVGIKIGTKLNSKAEVFGGIVLILLGIKLFLDGL